MVNDEEDEVLEEAKTSERRDFQSSNHKRGDHFLVRKSGFQSAGGVRNDASIINNAPQSSACENLTSSDEDTTEHKERNFGAMASSESL